MNRQKLIYTLIGLLVFSTLFAIVLFRGNGSGVNYEASFMSNNPGMQDRDLANSKLSNDRRNAITKAAELISPAVVGINVKTTRRINDPWYRMMYGDQVVQGGLGSGVIISPDGYILTNDHVANTEGATNSDITITLTDGTHHKANKVGADTYTDICLLKINTGKPLPYVNFGNSDDILIGEWVIAFGNPFGLFEYNDKPSVSVGVISSVEMNMGLVGDRAYVDMIQTDAAINPGNSGGPLVNINGELIGLNALIRPADNYSSGNIGLGFAIPVNKIKRIIDELKTKGEIDRAFMEGFGLEYLENTEQIAQRNRLPIKNGIIIIDVVPDSPAAKAGLKRLDIITQVGKYKTLNKLSFGAVIFEFRTGDSVPIKIVRGNETLTKTLKFERAKK